MCHVHFFGMLLLCVDDEGCHGVWPVDVSRYVLEVEAPSVKSYVNRCGFFPAIPGRREVASATC